MRTSRRLPSAAALLAASALALAGCSGAQDELTEPALTTVETSPADDTAETSAAEQPSSEQKEKKSTEEKGDSKDEADKDKAKDEKDEEKEEPRDDRSNVAAGTVCGEAGSRGDEGTGTLSVVTLDDGMDCDEVMEVFSDYMSDSPSGQPPQGSGAFWTAPNGWLCGGNNFLFPGDEDHKMNKYPSCGPQDVNKSAVAIPAARISELPI